MALTTKDILEISKLFNQGFEDIFLPQLKIEIDSLRVELNRSMNDHVEGLAAQIREANENIGYYFQKCATKERVEALEKRVKKLELARS